MLRQIDLAPIAPGFYRVPVLAKKATASVASIWRWAQKGNAPPIIKIGPGVSGGRRAEWDAFFADPEGWRAQRNQPKAA